MRVNNVKSRWAVVWGLILGGAAFGCTSPSETGPEVGGWERVTCESDADCPSGTCLSSGICGLACQTNDDCPSFRPWACENVGTQRQCMCTPKGVDVCNGEDDDCNGLVDDAPNACADGSVCEAGECVCSEANLCNGKCVDTRSDPLHCGECDNECMTGASCVDGQCWCSGTTCDGRCVDLQNDGDNCGACGTRCGVLGECLDGKCGIIDREWPRWSTSGQRFEPVAIWENGADTGRYDVRDVDTGLIWEKIVEFSKDDLLTWEGAKQHCDSFRGQKPLVGEPTERRWRLPTRIELLSIVDYARNNPALGDTFRGGAGNSSGTFWASTKSESEEDRAWTVSFKAGRAETLFMSARYHARCVK